jgi:hypothetical protein
VLAIGEDITDLIETSRKHKERLDTMALENKGLKRKIALVRPRSVDPGVVLSTHCMFSYCHAAGAAADLRQVPG